MPGKEVDLLGIALSPSQFSLRIFSVALCAISEYLCVNSLILNLL